MSKQGKQKKHPARETEAARAADAARAVPKVDNGVPATALVKMQAIGKTIEPNDRLMVTKAAYVPGDYRLDNAELQKAWDAAYDGGGESAEIEI